MRQIITKYFALTWNHLWQQSVRSTVKRRSLNKSTLHCFVYVCTNQTKQLVYNAGDPMFGCPEWEKYCSTQKRVQSKQGGAGLSCSLFTSQAARCCRCKQGGGKQNAPIARSSQRLKRSHTNGIECRERRVHWLARGARWRHRTHWPTWVAAYYDAHSRLPEYVTRPILNSIVLPQYQNIFRAFCHRFLLFSFRACFCDAFTILCANIYT